MSAPKHVIVGGLCLPLDLDSLESLPIDSGGVIQFDFTLGAVRFAVRFEEADAQGHLRLVADLGPLPFSAESPAARAGIHQIAEAANDALGPAFRLAQGRVLVGGDVPVPHPVTATALVGAIARMVIPLRPYMDLVGVYLRPPLEGGKPGAPALRPEWRRRAAPGRQGRG